MRLTPGSVAIAVVALINCTPALSQVRIPIISGDYVATIHVYCQPIFNINHNNGLISSVTLAQNPSTSYSIELEFYDARTSILTENGFTERGSSMLLNDDTAGPSGTPLTEVKDTITTFYSNDLATVTIGQTIYNVVWGLRKKDVAQYFVLQHLDPATHCMTQSIHVRRSRHAP
jgi:hypothetical protein